MSSERPAKINPSEMSFSLGKPMTYEEMMADRAKSSSAIERPGVEPPRVVPVSIPSHTVANQPATQWQTPASITKPKTVVGRDGTLYNLEQMQARRQKKNT